MLLPDDRCPPGSRRRHEGFCPISLTDWLRLAERAGVPHVPGVEVAVFERDDLRHHEYVGPHQKRLDAVYRQIADAAKPGTMMRWDCCASSNLKAAMSKGAKLEAIDDAVRNGLPLDARLLDILNDWPRLHVPVVRRPWLTNIARHNGYPVEYRAFVRNGRVRAISAYYVQTPLRRDDDELRQIRLLASALADAMEPPYEWPIHARAEHAAAVIAEKMKLAIGPKTGRTDDDRLDPNRPNCTMDFAVTTDQDAATSTTREDHDTRRVLFLEGGPPPEMGAHPCCFSNPPLEGVKLAADDEPPLPLSIAEQATPPAAGREQHAAARPADANPAACAEPRTPR